VCLELTLGSKPMGERAPVGPSLFFPERIGAGTDHLFHLLHLLHLSHSSLIAAGATTRKAYDARVNSL
jgi:hypothetical protein